MRRVRDPVAVSPYSLILDTDREVLQAVERSGLWTTDIEILRLHYAKTPQHWRTRFAASREQIADLYDGRFCRMFEFYLAGAQAVFSHSDHMVWQLQLCRDGESLPITRNHMMQPAMMQPAEAA